MRIHTGVLVMTMTIIGYTVLPLVGVSQEGSGAFQTKISPWVTMRIVTGSSLLIPSFEGTRVFKSCYDCSCERHQFCKCDMEPGDRYWKVVVV